jgi:hypothetical protein
MLSPDRWPLPVHFVGGQPNEVAVSALVASHCDIA